jgi:hypothetical protein
VNAPSVSDRPVRESLPAGRNVVVCLDGTSNKYDATNTNVVKLYAMLDKYDVDQLSYYQTGIGTFAPPGVWGKFKRWFFTRLDLAIAWLLEEHVTSAYRFLMRYYEQGDRIYIFGFSRGAYSARVLAAMLHKVGLLSRGNEELIPFAWDLFSRVRDIELATGFRDTFGRKVGVRFLGLWDTVSSVGWAWSPEHFQFTANNPSVQTIRHAVSLDERRTYFVQNLWTPESVPGQDCLRVWFPGVHCDVGGGYPEADGGLSKIALSWMVREAQVAGVRFHPATKERVLGDQQGGLRKGYPARIAERPLVAAGMDPQACEGPCGPVQRPLDRSARPAPVCCGGSTDPCFGIRAHDACHSSTGHRTSLNRTVRSGRGRAGAELFEGSAEEVGEALTRNICRPGSRSRRRGHRAVSVAARLGSER